MKKNYSKREFIKMSGLGALGLVFWQCYDKKENITEIKPVENQNTRPEITTESTETKIEYSEDDVIFFERNDQQYNDLKQGFNKRIQNIPAMIALCKTTKGVQAAIFKANQEKIKISVRSGGHSFESFSCNPDSLLIHLSPMNQINWIDNENIMIQPACTLSQMYDNLLPKNRIIAAGSCGSVGVGGLTLGGGYGFFSRKMGLTCDSLMRVVMVDAQGEIQDSINQPDLLWACKGGANGNFGVITELHFKTHTAPKSFSSYRLKFKSLDQEKFYTLCESWFQLTTHLPDEAFSAFVLNGSTLTILITNFLSHTPNFENIFQPLKSLATEYKHWPNQDLSKALKRYYGVQHPIFFKNASAGLYQNFDDIKDIAREVFNKVLANKGMIYQINTLGGNINDQNFEKASSYPHRGINYLSELQSYWEKESQGEKLLNAFQEIQEIFFNHGFNKQYRNYPDVNFKNWETAYYGKNYARLQEIKKKFDPNNLFYFEQSVRI